MSLLTDSSARRPVTVTRNNTAHADRRPALHTHTHTRFNKHTLQTHTSGLSVNETHAGASLFSQLFCLSEHDALDAMMYRNTFI